MSAMSRLYTKAAHTPEELTARELRLLQALLGMGISIKPPAEVPDVEAPELAELRTHGSKSDGFEPPNMGGCPCNVCEDTREALRLQWRRAGQARRIDVPEVSDESFARFFTA